MDSHQNDYYAKKLAQFGHTYKAVGWSSRQSQRKRFDAIASQINVEDYTKENPLTLLDVGCGLGDFYHYIKLKKLPCVYTGIDSCPQMIAAAKKSYPNGNFLVSALDNYIDARLNQPKFAVVVANGVFNIKGPNMVDNMVKQLKNCLQLASISVLVTMLTDKTPAKWQQNKLFFYYNNTKIDNLLKNQAIKTQWTFGYLPNDMLLNASNNRGLET